MLGKLLKYEMKATARIYLPIYILVAVLTPIVRFFAYNNTEESGPLDILPNMTILTYGIALFAIAVLAYVMIIYRFYKNLLTSEGYLMFTLPVSGHSLVLSKAIIGFFWMVMSVIIIILSIVGVSYTDEVVTEFTIQWKLIEFQISATPGINMSGFIALLVVTAIACCIYIIMFLYCSISIGQSLFSNHKIAGSIVTAIVLYIIGQIVSTILLSKPIDTNMSNMSIMIESFPMTILTYILISVIYYFITTTLLSRKLNLE